MEMLHTKTILQFRSLEKGVKNALSVIGYMTGVSSSMYIYSAVLSFFFRCAGKGREGEYCVSFGHEYSEKTGMVVVMHLLQRLVSCILLGKAC